MRGPQQKDGATTRKVVFSNGMAEGGYKCATDGGIVLKTSLLIWA